MSTLKQLWFDLNTGHEIAREAVKCWWEELSRRYNESQRYYHTLSHIEHMCTLWEEYKERLTDPSLVLYAVFFHDVIYDPTKGDNEEQSAHLFKEFALKHFPSKGEIDGKKVEKWILMTKTHASDLDGDQFGTEDHHYLLDMDMTILGVSETDYDGYSYKIRQEYIHVEESTYKRKRAEVLKTFLKEKRIYCTKDFYDKYEEIARSNINREIQRLES